MDAYAFHPFINGCEQTSSATKYCIQNTTATDRPMEIELSDLKGYIIKNPVHIARNNARNGKVYLSSKELNIFSCGSTLEESKLNFSEYLDFIWGEYVSCDPFELHESALNYRQWISDHFQRII